VWRKSLFNWEKDQLSQLLEVLHDSCPILGKVDRWVWTDVKFQEFSVNSAYNMLRGGFERVWSGMFNWFLRIKAFEGVGK